MTQNPEDHAQLERRVDRALKRLPYPAAPAAFSARVMRAVAVAEPARRAEWPVALKIAMSAAGFALIVGALLLWPLALELARTSWQSPGVALARAAMSAARPMVPIVLVYVTAMCVVSAAAVSMLKHVALGGATNS